MNLIIFHLMYCLDEILEEYWHCHDFDFTFLVDVYGIWWLVVSEQICSVY